MADFENAGYRLLSFKYTPTKAVKVDESKQHDGESAPTPAEAGELPSLEPLMTALPEVGNTDPTQGLDDKKAAAAAEAGHGKDNDAANDTHNDTPPESSPEVPSPPQAGPRFHLFGDLPPELRLKIWQLTFLPRTVELHPTRPNYSAVHDDPGRPPLWQSGCSNPAAVSVCAEARDIALKHFRIPFPLAAITADQESTPFARYAGDTSTYNFSGASVNGKARLLHRVLHVSPAHDTVALLGQDSDFKKLSQLMSAFREADPRAAGISRLALSVRGWGYGGSAIMMKTLGRTILEDLEQLTLFMYAERSPPHEWRVKGATLDEEALEQFRKTGNRCELIPCEGGSAWFAYRLWSGGKGRQFWDNDGRILRVGRNEMQIMDLEFKDGW